MRYGGQSGQQNETYIFRMPRARQDILSGEPAQKGGKKNQQRPRMAKTISLHPLIAYTMIENIKTNHNASPTPPHS